MFNEEAPDYGMRFVGTKADLIARWQKRIEMLEHLARNSSTARGSLIYKAEAAGYKQCIHELQMCAWEP
jgi:hypothetical protein